MGIFVYCKLGLLCSPLCHPLSSRMVFETPGVFHGLGFSRMDKDLEVAKDRPGVQSRTQPTGWTHSVRDGLKYPEHDPLS